jgi:hypothetical protein
MLQRIANNVNETAYEDSRDHARYSYKLTGKDRSGPFAALRLFYDTNAGQNMLKELPSVVKDTKKWKTTKIPRQIDKNTKLKFTVEFRDRIGKQDAQTLGWVDPYMGLTGNLALYMQEYRIFIKKLTSAFYGQLIEPSEVVSMARTLYHEFLHVWFSHWAHDPAQDENEVFAGLQKGLQYPTGHNVQKDGETEPKFATMVSNFESEAKTKISKFWPPKRR